MCAICPDHYTAIGVHSGSACGAASDMSSAFAAMSQGGAGGSRRNGRPGGPVLTIVFRGDRDTTVSPINGDQVIAQATTAADLATSVSRGEASGGLGFTRTVKADESGRPLLEQWSCTVPAMPGRAGALPDRTPSHAVPMPVAR